MANSKILLCLAHMSGQEMKYIQEAFDTNWVVPLGPNVNAFEQDLEQLCGENKHVVALSSGTAAIHLALVNLGIGRFGNFFGLFSINSGHGIRSSVYFVFPGFNDFCTV